MTGAALRRLRLLRGMKQGHLAELVGVAQTTISRWERGLLTLSTPHAAAIRAVFETRPCLASHDAALRGLVEGAARPVHLVCDRTHKLLAASPSRWAQWRVEPAAMAGANMLAFASPEILAAEAGLAELGWFEGRLPELIVETGGNGSKAVPIAPGRFVWRQIMLSDGSVARLTVTL
jgi:DNA-binding XRE family transcriptional regulator